MESVYDSASAYGEKNDERKVNNMEQVQVEYWWEMDNWKVNEFNFLNEEVEGCTCRWSQNLVNVGSPSYLKQKNFEYCVWDINRLYI